MDPEVAHAEVHLGLGGRPFQVEELPPRGFRLGFPLFHVFLHGRVAAVVPAFRDAVAVCAALPD